MLHLRERRSGGVLGPEASEVREGLLCARSDEFSVRSFQPLLQRLGEVDEPRRLALKASERRFRYLKVIEYVPYITVARLTRVGEKSEEKDVPCDDGRFNVAERDIELAPVWKSRQTYDLSLEMDMSTSYAICIGRIEDAPRIATTQQK